MTELEVYRCPFHGFEFVDSEYIKERGMDELVCSICGNRLVCVGVV